jgi:hypothetical protein
LNEAANSRGFKHHDAVVIINDRVHKYLTKIPDSEVLARAGWTNVIQFAKRTATPLRAISKAAVGVYIANLDAAFKEMADGRWGKGEVNDTTSQTKADH